MNRLQTGGFRRTDGDLDFGYFFFFKEITELSQKTEMFTNEPDATALLGNVIWLQRQDKQLQRRKNWKTERGSAATKT